ncbi:hypothetical protein SAMN05660477_02606 [Soonwooa buanensis]|uniref:PBCV-specific basic adaptor domain-containing protein n=1 Tax=Soonwooa buanensis TaxID=619805 RepID=A0A1T5G6X0_9FLAO|nr:hypothetical protein SAMN05660477_02606 [Soonwooa buanensis]
MKFKLFTLTLVLGFLFTNSLTNNLHAASGKYYNSLQTKKKKGTKKKSTSSTKKSCTYNGHSLYVGKRGGCYYYSGDSKVYVDRDYCIGCR